MAKINKEALIDYWNLVQKYACQGGKKREGLSEADLDRIYKDPQEKGIYEKGEHILDNIADSVVKKFQQIVHYSSFLSGRMHGSLFSRPYHFPSSTNDYSDRFSERSSKSFVTFRQLSRQPTRGEIDQLKNYILAPFLSLGISMNKKEWVFSFFKDSIVNDDPSLSFEFLGLKSDLDTGGDGFLAYKPPVCTDTPRYVKKTEAVPSSDSREIKTVESRKPAKTVSVGEPDHLTQVGHKVIFVPKSLISTITHHPRLEAERLDDIRKPIERANPHQQITDDELRQMTHYIDDGVRFIPFR